MRIWSFCAGVVIAACIAGCGGDDDTALFTGAGGGQGGLGGSAGGGGSSGAAGSQSGGTTNQGDSSFILDAVVLDGDMPYDGGVVDTPLTIRCGDRVCALDMNWVCCVDRQNVAPYQCAERGSCPSSMQTPVELQCGSDANCGYGSVCCLSHSTGTNNVARCQTACYPAEIHLCDPKAARTGCETFQTCAAHTIDLWGLPAALYAMCE